MLFLQIQELNGKKFENPQTANLHKILEDSISITELLKERNNNSTEGNTAGETDNTVRNQMLSVHIVNNNSSPIVNRTATTADIFRETTTQLDQTTD